MCYSAHLKQKVEWLERTTGAVLDIDAYRELFHFASEQPQYYALSKAMYQDFLRPGKRGEEKLKPLAERYQQQQIALWEQEKAEAQAVLAELETKLARKETKTNRLNHTRKQKKIKQLNAKIAHIKKEQLSHDDHRIFPGYYGNGVIQEAGQLKIVPMRYRFFRATGNILDDLLYDKNSTLYNCRSDALTPERFAEKKAQLQATYKQRLQRLKKHTEDILSPKSIREKNQLQRNLQLLEAYGYEIGDIKSEVLKQSVWEPALGHQHGILFMEKFYEHVQRHDYEQRPLAHNESAQSVTISFYPDTAEILQVPVLYTKTAFKNGRHMLSCAIITQEPPAEVLAHGHDRCPIHLARGSQFLQAQQPEQALQALTDIKAIHFVASDQV